MWKGYFKGLIGCHWSIFLLLIFGSLRNFAQPLQNDDATLLLLRFDNTATGADGETPISLSNLTYTSGKHGQAAVFNSATVLKFDTAGNLITQRGTIEFWIKPETNGQGLVIDMRTTNGFYIQSGPLTAMEMNTLANNPYPLVTAISGNCWFPNTWNHLAFTWGDRNLKMYFNGKLIQTVTYNFDLFPVPLNQFSIGANVFNNSQHFLGALDELRISSRPRSEGEICQSYIQGLGALQNLSTNVQTISLFKGWNVYFNKPDTYQSPIITATINGTPAQLGASCFNWIVADESIVKFNTGTMTLTAIGVGNTFITGYLGNLFVKIPIEVKNTFKQQERLLVSNDFLTTPATCHSKRVPVAIIMYIPTDDGINLNITYGGTTFTDVEKLKVHCLNISRFAKFSLEEGSRFRGYSNPNAKPYLGYEIVECIVVYEPPPLCYLKRPNVYQPDYNQIMERHGGRRLVDTLGVREIWMFSGDWQIAEGDESNMASKTTGDISNSLRRNDDLPIYENTYILYNYSMQRGGNEAVHNHGHQIESMVSYVASQQDGNAALFWQNFVGRSGPNFSNPPIGRCGDTHHPPNTIVDYDYCNNTLVASDIFDWKPSGGNTTLVNCSTWNNLPYSWPPITLSGLGCCDAGELPDANSRFFILWMQSIPGNGNLIPHNTKSMTNWWRFMADWDSANTRIGLYQDFPEQNLDGCQEGGITYSFTGNGKWSNVENWANRMRPPNPMPPGHKIIIDHTEGGNCLVDIPYVLFNGIQLHVNPGKNLIWQKNP